MSDPAGQRAAGGGGGGGGGSEGVVAMHAPLVQTPRQHSVVCRQGWPLGWQAHRTSPFTTAVCFWQQRLQERIRALPCLLCPRGFLLGQGLPVGMQAAAWTRRRWAFASVVAGSTANAAEPVR